MTNKSTSIAQCLHQLRQAIPAQVTLIAVSKTKPASDVMTAYQAGQRDFGENYVQEGVEKVQTLKESCPQAIWHFIGHCQSNKSKLVAEHFDWMHTIDRLKIAQRLSMQRPSQLPPMNVCIQINIDGSASKSGIKPEQAEALCTQTEQLDHLKLRGLMAVPDPENDRAFHDMAILFNNLRPKFSMDTLSMGMSNDFEHAIESGATHVRIGSAIFGARKP